MGCLTALFHELRALEFGPIVTKEILCAAAGLKVTRVSATDADVAKLERLLPAQGIELMVSKTKYGIAQDAGKGGWSNRFTDVVVPDAPEGYWKLYIAVDPTLMFRAREHDADGADNFLGESLGIPDCCRTFFDAFAKQAFEKQGDLVPFTFLNTAGGYPFNFWNNSACQYFGYSLLSFSPCSFHCPHAAEVASKTYAFLRQVDADFAERFVEQHRRSILYTEYDGVFSLIDAEYDTGVLSYRVANATCAEGAVAKAIDEGDCIVSRGPYAFTIQAGATVLKECKGIDFALCIFAEDKLGKRQGGRSNQSALGGLVV
jgi:hypothetical protein